MKVKFYMKTNVGKIQVKNVEEFKPMQVEDATVLWGIGINQELRDISIVFNGVDITKDTSGVILTTNRALDEKAFKIATFISNKIFLATGIDGLDPEKILYDSPIIYPANEEEKQIIEKGKKQGFSTFGGVVTIINPSF